MGTETKIGMNRQLGVGVLGLQEGRTLLVALNGPEPPPVGENPDAAPRTKYARAVAGCDLRQEKLDAAERACPDIFYTTDYATMLAHDAVDFVAIFTPDHLHGQHIVEAFQAGKDVICTKPLVNSMADAQMNLKAARRTGRKLLVGQSLRFFESFLCQRRAYERGEVGEVELVDAHYIHRMGWYYDKSPWVTETSDWVYLGLSHPLDLARWYLGPIEEVHAVGTRSALARRCGSQAFDIYSVNLWTADGRVGRVMGHYGLRELPSARNAVELVLYGSDGTSMAQYHDMRYYHTTPEGTEVMENMLYRKRAYYFNNEVHGMHYGEFANYTDYFALALLAGSDYAPDLEEGLETFCIMEAVRRSAQTGRSVAIPPLLQEIGQK